MRLSEIISTSWQQPRPGTDTKITPSQSDLGTGYFSVVKIDPADPHMVPVFDQESAVDIARMRRN